MRLTILIYILGLTIIPINNVVSQSYILTAENRQFEFLENANLGIDASWGSPVFQLPIGFEFEFFDIISDTIYSAYNSFGGYTSLNQDEDNLYMLIHFFANFIDRGLSQDTLLSPIYYKTEGSEGNRVFTLEYNHMGFFFGSEAPNGIYLDYINIQTRLFESSGDIEFHIGPYSIMADPQEVFDVFPGPLIGIMSKVENSLGGNIGEVVILTGDPANPNVTDNPFSFLNWPIPENTVYRFSKSNTSSTNFSKPEYTNTLYPNPASNFITISDTVKFEKYSIYSIDGRKILESKFKTSDISFLDPGYYIIYFSNNNIEFTSSFIKK